MLASRRGWARGVIGLAVLMGLGAAATAGLAASGYTQGTYGYDVSWPQCGAQLPADPGFAIVGVTGGKSLGGNPCLREQGAWAATGDQPMSLYINTNGAPKRYTNAACERRDASCLNFEYGRAAAKWAVAYAQANGVGSVDRYWLDVETANSWSRDKNLNARALEGFRQGLEESGMTVMGIYSTSYQWGRIAGSYAPGLDNWVPRPGIEWPGGAQAACASTPAFAGGRVVMIQAWETFDENYVCG